MKRCLGIACTTMLLAAALEVGATDPEPRFFPIGMYSVDDEGDFKEIADAGFNLVQSYRFEGETASDAEVLAYLDAADKFGLRVLLGIPQEAVERRDVCLIRKRVATFMDHPALYGWQLFDEPESGASYGREGPLPPKDLIEAYRAIKSVDSSHPVSIACSGTLDEYEYLEGADTIMLQYNAIPPDVFEAPWDSLSHMGDFMNPAIDIAARNNKGLMLALTGYNVANDYYIWPKERRGEKGQYPTQEEMRFVAYYSIVRGVSDLIFSCYRFDYGEGPDGEALGGDDISHKANPKQWHAISAVASELKSMIPIFSAPSQKPGDAGVTITGTGNVTVEMMIKEYQGKTYLITVNPAEFCVQAQIRLAPDRFPDPSITLLPESLPISSKQGAFDVHWKPYEVRIYEVTASR